MSSDESTGASGAGGLAQRVLDEHGEALRADGLALALGPEAVGPDFVTRASEALAAAEAQTDGVTCVAIVTDPDAPLLGEDVPLEDERAALQEIAVRLADEAFPLVLTVIEARGIASVPTILVVGTDGVSDDAGNSGRWPERFHDDFRVDPAPALELAALQGAARLGAAETPDPRDYAGSGPACWTARSPTSIRRRRGRRRRWTTRWPWPRTSRPTGPCGSASAGGLFWRATVQIRRTDLVRPPEHAATAQPAPPRPSIQSSLPSKWPRSRCSTRSWPTACGHGSPMCAPGPRSRARRRRCTARSIPSTGRRPSTETRP